jgi:ethanolamine kinase
MDAQSLNFLKSSNDFDDLKLIDFEYSGMHPRAADIANTFCEYCDMNNLKGRWEEEYPTEAQQEEFLDAYLARCEVEMDAASRQQFQHEVNKHALVSHLGWATWSVLQHSLSDIDFDYLAYARHRMDGYRYFKKKYWSEEP